MKKKVSCPKCEGRGLIAKWNDCSVWSEYCFECNGTGKIEVPIARKENSIIERCVNSNGDYALTYYELIKNYHDFCLVKFVLKTGRTHQIRLHSQYIGHPILGDTLYGSSSNLINRQALHCTKLSFMHPITKKELKLEAPIPLDMQSLINLS